jgi:hypothetical protein
LQTQFVGLGDYPLAAKIGADNEFIGFAAGCTFFNGAAKDTTGYCANHRTNGAATPMPLRVPLTASGRAAMIVAQ